MPVIITFMGWRLEDQKFKVMLGSLVGLKTVWAIWRWISNRKRSVGVGEEEEKQPPPHHLAGWTIYLILNIYSQRQRSIFFMKHGELHLTHVYPDEKWTQFPSMEVCLAWYVHTLPSFTLHFWVHQTLRSRVESQSETPCKGNHTDFTCPEVTTSWDSEH